MRRKRQHYQLYNIYSDGVMIDYHVPFSRAKKYIKQLDIPSLFGGTIENPTNLQIENITTGQIYEH